MKLELISLLEFEKKVLLEKQTLESQFGFRQASSKQIKFKFKERKIDNPITRNLTRALSSTHQ